MHVLVNRFKVCQNVQDQSTQQQPGKNAFKKIQKTNKGKLSNLENKLLIRQVQRQVYQYILETPIAVGAKLPSEFELGDGFSVGRSTIRGVVRLLISRGILEVKRGSGTYVVSTTSVDTDPLGLGAVEDKMALALDSVNVRIILEPGIAGVVALNAIQEDVLKLRNLCDSAERRIETGDSYIEDDIVFHTCVAECSENEVVEQLIPIIDTTVLMFVDVTHKKLTDETIMTHRVVTEAAAEYDPIDAKTAMMMHMTFNKNIIRQLMKDGREAWERTGSVIAVRECDGDADI